jgi:hypothetical protein
VAEDLRLADSVMRVSHETIYLSLFVQSRGALRRELQRCLRTGRATRYPWGKRLPQGRGQLRDTLHISQRPPEAADRAVPGHWDGDLVLGKRPSAVGTLVERHSRYVLLFPLPDGFTAQSMRPALTAAVLRSLFRLYAPPVERIVGGVMSDHSTRTAALAATSAEAAVRFAEALARACAAALGRAVAGVILHGSLVLGDYLPGRSDVDLLVVVDEPLGDARLAALVEAMASRRAEAPGPVDLRLVTRQVAASPTPAPPLEAYLRLTPSSGVRVEERRHPAERDLAVELAVCRAHGRSLLGAAPAALLGEVPDRWVVAAGDAQLAAWQAIGDDPRYAELTVLTACRLWRFAEKGRHASKAAAAQWALGRDPTLGVVGDALRRRHRDPAARIDPAQVARLLAVVRARLAGARDGT